jgi:hypothetical protein
MSTSVLIEFKIYTMAKHEEFKLFNGREEYIILECLREGRETSLMQLAELVEKGKETGKRPIFTKRFIEQEFDQLIEKVKENTQHEYTS